MDPDHWVLRWYCQTYGISPLDPSLDDICMARVWVLFVENEIVLHMAEHPKKKVEEIEVGDIWVELGNSVRAIKKRLLKDRPSLGEDKALEMARRMYQEQQRGST